MSAAKAPPAKAPPAKAPSAKAPPVKPPPAKAPPPAKGRFHDQADSVQIKYYSLIVIENTKYALQMANLCAADRPPASRPPTGRIILTPQQPLDYYPFNIRLIMEFT
jgi:hypothetical protein